MIPRRGSAKNLVIFVFIVAAVTSCRPAEPAGISTPSGSPPPSPRVSPAETVVELPLASPTVTPTPAPPPAVEWTHYVDPVLGIAIDYPTAWVVAEATPANPLMLASSTQVLGGVFPAGSSAVTIQQSGPPSPMTVAEPIQVGTDGYPGLVTVEDRNVYGSPSQVITVSYSAAGAAWTITGFFAKEADGSVPQATLYWEIVASIGHVQPPEPAPQPQPMPESILSPAYLDPQAAIVLALEEVTGVPYSPTNPGAQLYLERADPIRHLYHLVTSEVGFFNSNTMGFYSWLVEYITWFQSADGYTYLNELREHAYAQIRAAIYDPESDIGRRVRAIEAGSDPDFIAPGPSAYWVYLIEPYCEAALVAGALARDACQAQFQRLVDNYAVEQLRDPYAYSDFGAFLASQAYEPFQ